MKVEIFSDIACPFCFIGKRHFEAALTDLDDSIEVDVVWRSFQLDPGAPREAGGRGTAGRLSQKYGISIEEAEAMVSRVADMGAACGLRMDFDRVLAVNTFDAHRITHLARELSTQEGGSSLQDRLVEALFGAYFTTGEDVADPAVLAELAAGVGIDREEVRRVLESDRFSEAVRADLEQAVDFGLGGVPAFVIDRSMLVSGAQPPEVLLAALQQAAEAATSSLS